MNITSVTVSVLWHSVYATRPENEVGLFSSCRRQRQQTWCRQISSSETFEH